ncbi:MULTISPECIES: hypothetical protein [unclassified Streptomyces]|uniref:hypothetical protein n=1 Tax=unclassified Streptomyces TaxID=2593676 RepID=UPI0035DC3F40
MNYAYAVKRLPQTDDPAVEDPGVSAPPDPQPPHEDDSRPWAGDVYDEGDETDPVQAYASLSGPAGEEAWLDQAEDQTLTGWVRDETGQVWRYSDPDAWAIDVDDAGMVLNGSTATPASAPPAEGQAPREPAAAGAPASGAGGGLPLDFGTADQVVSADDPSGEEAEEYDGAPVEEEDADDTDVEEDDTEDPGFPLKKKRTKG